MSSSGSGKDPKREVNMEEELREARGDAETEVGDDDIEYCQAPTRPISPETEIITIECWDDNQNNENIEREGNHQNNQNYEEQDEDIQKDDIMNEVRWFLRWLFCCGLMMVVFREASSLLD
ncbi:unnamed protein product [Acanthoscelides obtectus]|uniref:Uncharacterized protein n=1 Tax=Acanthoscelides obtectus TaxID=200917 RepID=A0A9P0K8M6_ACAOB|nr:unnamed protein product [Acanthoscelides obtectus]CAK1628091.1 hypothetical protein AOBTE_LOCUS5023 [Acanthoscelides obtectus]